MLPLNWPLWEIILNMAPTRAGFRNRFSSDPFDKPVKGTFQNFFMIDKWIFVGQLMAWIPEHQWLSFLRLTFYQVDFIYVVNLLFVVTKNCGAVSNPIINTLIIIIIIIHIDCLCWWHLAFNNWKPNVINKLFLSHSALWPGCINWSNLRTICNISCPIRTTCKIITPLPFKFKFLHTMS